MDRAGTQGADQPNEKNGRRGVEKTSNRPRKEEWWRPQPVEIFVRQRAGTQWVTKTRSYPGPGGFNVLLSRRISTVATDTTDSNRFNERFEEIQRTIEPRTSTLPVRFRIARFLVAPAPCRLFLAIMTGRAILILLVSFFWILLGCRNEPTGSGAARFLQINPVSGTGQDLVAVTDPILCHHPLFGETHAIVAVGDDNAVVRITALPKKPTLGSLVGDEAAASSESIAMDRFVAVENLPGADVLVNRSSCWGQPISWQSVAASTTTPAVLVAASFYYGDAPMATVGVSRDCGETWTLQCLDHPGVGSDGLLKAFFVNGLFFLTGWRNHNDGTAAMYVSKDLAQTWTVGKVRVSDPTLEFPILDLRWVEETHQYVATAGAKFTFLPKPPPPRVNATENLVLVADEGNPLEWRLLEVGSKDLPPDCPIAGVGPIGVDSASSKLLMASPQLYSLEGPRMHLVPVSSLSSGWECAKGFAYNPLVQTSQIFSDCDDEKKWTAIGAYLNDLLTRQILGMAQSNDGGHTWHPIPAQADLPLSIFGRLIPRTSSFVAVAKQGYVAVGSSFPGPFKQANSASFTNSVVLAAFPGPKNPECPDFGHCLYFYTLPALEEGGEGFQQQFWVMKGKVGSPLLPLPRQPLGLGSTKIKFAVRRSDGAFASAFRRVVGVAFAPNYVYSTTTQLSYSSEMLWVGEGPVMSALLVVGDPASNGAIVFVGNSTSPTWIRSRNPHVKPGPRQQQEGPFETPEGLGSTKVYFFYELPASQSLYVFDALTLNWTLCNESASLPPSGFQSIQYSPYHKRYFSLNGPYSPGRRPVLMASDGPRLGGWSTVLVDPAGRNLVESVHRLYVSQTGPEVAVVGNLGMCYVMRDPHPDRFVPCRQETAKGGYVASQKLLFATFVDGRLVVGGTRGLIAYETELTE